jgi:hypothetical protein
MVDDSDIANGETVAIEVVHHPEAGGSEEYIFVKDILATVKSDAIRLYIFIDEKIYGTAITIEYAFSYDTDIGLVFSINQGALRISVGIGSDGRDDVGIVSGQRHTFQSSTFCNLQIYIALQKMVLVKYTPEGTLTIPPPDLDALSIAAWICVALLRLLPTFAPKSVIRNTCCEWEMFMKKKKLNSVKKYFISTY